MSFAQHSSPFKSSSSSFQSNNDNDIKLYLSRSVYPLNSSIVGTVTTSSRTRSSSSNDNNKYKSIKVYIAGRCRVDSRWHYKDVQESIQKLYKSGGLLGYGGHPCHTANNLPPCVEETAVNCYFKTSGAGTNNYLASANNAISTIANAESSHVHIDTGIVENKKQHESTPKKKKTSSTSSSSSSKNQTFCFWSTNVLTLCQNGKPNPNIPIYTEGNSSSSCSSIPKDNGLKMANSTWYTQANRIEYMIQEGERIDPKDLYDLEYDDDENDDHYHETKDWKDKNDNNMDNVDIQAQKSNGENDNEQDYNQKREKGNDNNNDDDNNGMNDNLVHQMNNLEITNSNQQEEEIKPSLIQSNAEQNYIITEENTTNQSKHAPTNNHMTRLNNTNFTFKADLPNDLPLTANAASVRYFYSVVLVIQTNDDQLQILQAPFTVVTSKSIVLDDLGNTYNNKNMNNQSLTSTSTVSPPPVQTKIRIGTIHAIAHPTHNPISLSSTFEAEPWRTSVERVYGGWDTTNVRSITLEQDGYTCGKLTIVGGVVLHPGEKVLLHFDFDDNNDMNRSCNDKNHDGDGHTTYAVQNEPLPCYMVSACLQGAEYALYQEKNTRKKSRSYFFDAAYSYVDPDCTKNVSLNLSLPLDCPMTLNTDLVKIDISCRVDLTVKMPHSASFQFLTVEFPCYVVSGLAVGEEKNGVDDDSMLSKEVVNKIMDCKKMSSDEDDNDYHKVICPEILDDLSMLTMHILECN